LLVDVVVVTSTTAASSDRSINSPECPSQGRNIVRPGARNQVESQIDRLVVGGWLFVVRGACLGSSKAQGMGVVVALWQLRNTKSARVEASAEPPTTALLVLDASIDRDRDASQSSIDRLGFQSNPIQSNRSIHAACGRGAACTSDVVTSCLQRGSTRVGEHLPGSLCPTAPCLSIHSVQSITWGAVCIGIGSSRWID
jgi:hypothetical protein